MIRPVDDPGEAAVECTYHSILSIDWNLTRPPSGLSSAAVEASAVPFHTYMSARSCSYFCSGLLLGYVSNRHYTV